MSCKPLLGSQFAGSQSANLKRKERRSGKTVVMEKLALHRRNWGSPALIQCCTGITEVEYDRREVALGMESIEATC